MSEQGRIEDGLAQTRSRMNNRLSDLQARLTPDRIVDDVVAYVKGSDGAEFARNLVAGAKCNPIPAAIAGIGFAWLMAANSRDRQIVEPTALRASASPPWTSVDEFDDHVGRVESSVVRGHEEDETIYTDRLHDARGHALGIARGAKDTTTSYAARISDAMTSTRDGLMRRAHDTRDSASSIGQTIGNKAADLQSNASNSARYAGARLAEGGRAAQRTGVDILGSVMDSPIMLGAIGLGVGALLGAIVPQTDAEEQLLGGLAGEARNALRDVAQDVLDRGGAATQQTVAVGRESAQAHGLAGDRGLADLARDAGDGSLSGDAASVTKDVLKAVDGALRTK